MYIPAIGGIQPGTGSGGGTSAAAPAFTESILGAAANNITVTLSDPDKVYTAAFHIKSNASSNLIFVTLNGDTAQTGYNVLLGYSHSSTQYSNAAASNNSAILQSAALASGDFASGTLNVKRIYDGANTRFVISFITEIAGGHTHGHITKTASGNVALSSLQIRSNQTDGFTAASYLKPLY